MNTPSSKSILFVHGRGSKPGADDLHAIWQQALQSGLRRDFPKQPGLLDGVATDLFYYADDLQPLFEPDYKAGIDLQDRNQTLQALQAFDRSKQFRRKLYESLPGKTPLPEFTMDLGASLGLGGLLTKQRMPELHHYWQNPDGWSDRVRQRCRARIEDLLDAGSELMIISHCLGSVVVWDALWQLSKANHPGVVSQWVTMGSPLASRAVRQRLLGHDQTGAARFPANLTSWHNISAEDDYVCHDKTVADDFHDMLATHRISEITDYTIYNPAVRWGRSNPHHSAGYLIHPRTVSLVRDWLASGANGSA